MHDCQQPSTEAAHVCTDGRCPLSTSGGPASLPGEMQPVSHSQSELQPGPSSQSQGGGRQNESTQVSAGSHAPPAVQAQPREPTGQSIGAATHAESESTAITPAPMTRFPHQPIASS